MHSHIRNFTVLFLLWLAPLSGFAQQHNFFIPDGWIKLTPGTTEYNGQPLGTNLLNSLKQKGCQLVVVEPERIGSARLNIMVVCRSDMDQDFSETDDYFEKLNRQIKDSWKNSDHAKFIEGTVFTFSGIKILRATTDMTNKRTGHLSRILQYIYKDGDKLAIVTCGCKVDDFPHYGPIFQEAITKTLTP